MGLDLVFGITERGIMHTDADPPFSLEERFRMVRDSGVYDYYDKTPESFEEEAAYRHASETHGVPMLAGGWFYTLGRDEALFDRKLALSARLGARVHNTQILWHHADGHPVTDEEVAEFYLHAAEQGEATGCMPTFEVHINMWSEDFRRVERVAELVERRGVPFRMTLDHSHVIYKIDNPEQQAIRDIRAAVASGELVLDPFAEGSVCRLWIEHGWVWHAHARAAVPDNPRNTWARHEDGSFGRGVQYPFIRPEPGQYLAVWDERKLEPFKEVIRQLMRYHVAHPDSPLGQISTEFIPRPDYGGGHGYSIFENSVACARWMRETWHSIRHAQLSADTTVYHVCRRDEWTRAERAGVYQGSSQDQADGFIHFSSFDQVAASTAKHRAGQDDLVLIGADTRQLGDALKFEPSRGGKLFPHLYGPLPIEAVTVREPVRLDARGAHRFPAGFDRASGGSVPQLQQ